MSDHDPGDENDHVERCYAPAYTYGYTIACERPKGHDDKYGHGRKIRGVDRPCEECGAQEGCFLERGFHRCQKCGYPGQ